MGLKQIELALAICPNARDPNIMRLEALLSDENIKLALQYIRNLVPNAFRNYESRNLNLNDLKPSLWRMPDKEHCIDVKLLLYYAKALIMNSEFDKTDYLLNKIPTDVKHYPAVSSCLERCRLMKVYIYIYYLLFIYLLSYLYIVEFKR